MKKLLLHIFFLFLGLSSLLAQKSELIVKRSDEGLYLDHKVASKESFYALGRLYNVSPKYLATYNKLELAKGLQLDQKMRIPLTDTNFYQTGGSGTPVYYKVGDKEGLMSVSNKNKGVKLANLRWWNNLTTDELKKDSKLIIGFLQSNEMKKITIAGSPVENPVVTDKAPDVDLTKKEEKKIEEEEIKAEKKEEKKKENTEPVIPVKEIKNPPAEGQGYFKSNFEQQVKITPVTRDETVTAGIFKTISGWQDAKYYLLIDKVQPGTIVKITNPTNNKAIYAKVLGEMSGIRQNQGLGIRISNAGAAALEVAEQDKFILKLNY